MRAAGTLAILTMAFAFTATNVVQAAQVSVRNCSQWTATISAFNSGDPVKMIPYMQINIPSRQTGTAECASDSSCDLRIRIQNTRMDAPYTRHSICLSAQESQGHTTIWTDLPSCKC